MNNILKHAAAILFTSMWSYAATANIVIGQSAPMTGKNAELGQDIRRGAMAWFDIVNARGGINGNKIDLVTLDDKNEAAQSGKNAKILIDEHRAIALFGFASATLSAPALPMIKERSMVLFSPITGADAIHGQNPLVFTTRASYRDETAKLLEMWTGIFDKYAVVHYDDAIGKQNYDAVVAILKPAGITPKSVALKRNAPVPKSVVPDLIASEPKLILFTTNAAQIVEIVKQLKEANAYISMASLSFAGPNVLKDALGKYGSGMAIATVVPPYMRVGVPIVNEYEKAMKRAGNTQLSYTSLEAFIAARALTEGLKRAGPTPTRKTLLAGLGASGNMDFGGYNVNFASGSPRGSNYVDIALIGSNGNFK